MKKKILSIAFNLIVFIAFGTWFGYHLHTVILNAEKFKKDEESPKEYKIIFNNDFEAMPAENGYLKVQKFKGDTVYVDVVENLDTPNNWP